jgi:hypothetical protein
MNCKDINQALIDRSIASPLPSGIEDHLRTCARCRRLVAALSLPIPEARPSRESLRRIETGIAADLRPVRPIAPKSYVFAAFVAIFIAVVALGVSRMGAFAIAVMSPLQTSVILGALAISTGLLVYSLTNQMVPGSRHRISPRLLPLGAVISLMIVIAVLFPFQHELNFWANSWACIRAGTPLGALAAVPFWFVLRRGTILSPPMTGAATGLLAGLVGATTLQIHCPNLDAWHILVGHLGVAALGSMTGLLLGVAAENGLLPRRLLK